MHACGIKVVFDGVFNHVGRNFWAFKDLQQNGRKSIYIDWFCGVDFNNTSSYGDAFSYDGWYDAYNLVKLNLRNEEVKSHIFAAVGTWIDQFGIDGIRLDVAEIMDKDFLADLAVYCKQRCDDCWLLGEVIQGGPALAPHDQRRSSIISDHIKLLTGLRRNCPSLRRGTYQTLKVSAEHLVYTRSTLGEVTIVVLNAGSAAIALVLDIGDSMPRNYEELLANGQSGFKVEKNKLYITDIPAYGARILLGKF